jgi:hypothetical protein
MATIVACDDITKLVALVLRVNRSSAMAKDTKSFHPIVVGETFLQPINHSIVIHLWG